MLMPLLTLSAMPRDVADDAAASAYSAITLLFRLLRKMPC